MHVVLTVMITEKVSSNTKLPLYVFLVTFDIENNSDSLQNDRQEFFGNTAVH